MPAFYQNKVRKQRIQDVVKINKIKFKPYTDLVDQDFSRFNDTLINNEDPHSQIGNCKIPRVDEN